MQRSSRALVVFVFLGLGIVEKQRGKPARESETQTWQSLGSDHPNREIHILFLLSLTLSLYFFFSLSVSVSAPLALPLPQPIWFLPSQSATPTTPTLQISEGKKKKEKDRVSGKRESFYLRYRSCRDRCLGVWFLVYDSCTCMERGILHHHHHARKLLVSLSLSHGRKSNLKKGQKGERERERRK